MKKFDTLTFSASDTNETISKKIADRVKEVSLKEITEEDNKNKDGNKAITTKSMESVAKKL